MQYTLDLFTIIIYTFQALGQKQSPPDAVDAAVYKNYTYYTVLEK